MDQLKLGMSRKKVENLLGQKLIYQEMKHYDFFSVDNENQRLVMFFKDEKLDAFARGSRSRENHKDKTRIRN